VRIVRGWPPLPIHQVKQRRHPAAIKRRRALRDIENIHEYIEKRNPRAAGEVVLRIRSAGDRL
jgi:plasmid stabilization system protein ParE